MRDGWPSTACVGSHVTFRAPPTAVEVAGSRPNPSNVAEIESDQALVSLAFQWKLCICPFRVTRTCKPNTLAYLFFYFLLPPLKPTISTDRWTTSTACGWFNSMSDTWHTDRYLRLVKKQGKLGSWYDHRRRSCDASTSTRNASGPACRYWCRD